MKKEQEKERIELESNLHHTILKDYILLSLQDEEETRKAIKYNAQENNKYIFLAQNLINTRCLDILLANDYQVHRCYSDIFKNDVIIISK